MKRDVPENPSDADTVPERPLTFSERKIRNALCYAEERARLRRRSLRSQAALSVVLGSRKGQRVDGGTCHCCGNFSRQRWRYRHSTSGEVVICDRCKPGAFERSYDKVDALNHARLAGRFDGQRRRR